MPPVVAEYSIRKTYGKILGEFERAFQRKDPLFTLPIYYPLHFYIGKRDDIDPFEENRQRQVVGLIRSMFLKRFESSVFSFNRSLNLLMRKLLAFLEVNVLDGIEREMLENWKRRHAGVIDYNPERQLELTFHDDESAEDEDDLIPS